MYPIPILLVFFNRPDKLKVVFDEIKKIKPNSLFLYQDGPRECNESDCIKIKKCREIIDDISWPCTVYKFFQEKNVGCDPSGFIAHSWFFDNVKYGIVLEDDCVPSSGFFKLCEYALPKYADNDKIAMISGMNLLGVCNLQYPYFFSAHGGIWGWASWSRFYKKCDPTYSWLDDKKSLREIRKDFSTRQEARKFIKLAKKRKVENKPYFETLVYAAARKEHMLELIPTKNTIMNIGVDNGAHSNGNLDKISKVEKKYNYQKTYNFEKPLSEVPIIRNRKYEKKILLSLFDKISIRIHRFFKN